MMETNHTPRHFFVASPEYGEVVPLLDYGEGPMEYRRDCVHVIAPNKRAAKVLGVRALRADPKAHYFPDHCDGSPFAGMLVEECKCPHGVMTCGCDGKEFECEECDADEIAELDQMAELDMES